MTSLISHLTVKEHTIVTKQENISRVGELVDKFQSETPFLKKHIFNMRNQYRVYRNIHENLTPGMCLIHNDFSENYCGKYASEIQSVHFGGSHQQMSLHTGVLSLKDEVIPFCSISPNTQHDPPAI